VSPLAQLVLTFFGIAGAIAAMGTWLYTRGQKEGRLEAAAKSIEDAATRISAIPQMQEIQIAQSDKIRRQDSVINELREKVASLDGRKISSSALLALQRPQSSHEWFVAPHDDKDEEKR